jgi:dienelactone hydrolase
MVRRGIVVACSALLGALLLLRSAPAGIRDYVRDTVPGARGPAQPAQPETGPGGSDYKHAAVTEKEFGDEENHVSLFLPEKPMLKSAPVVVFLHGWGALRPAVYRAWIDHIVRRGSIVIFPQYQRLNSRGPEFAPNAVKAVKQAIAQLQAQGPVKPDLERFALVGHSAGAVCAVNVAALAAAEGLPKPKALMVVEPGRWINPDNPDPKFGIPLEDLSRIPAGALILVVVGDADERVGDVTAKEIFKKLGHIPRADKNYIVVQSDNYGYPPLVANHASPAAGLGAAVDALDYYAYWKLFDALTDAAFHDKNRNYALGNTAEQRFMGTWGDGRAVRELVVTDAP